LECNFSQAQKVGKTSYVYVKISTIKAFGLAETPHHDKILTAFAGIQ